MKNKKIASAILGLAITGMLVTNSNAMLGATLPKDAPEGTMVIMEAPITVAMPINFTDISGIKEEASILTMRDLGFIKGTESGKFDPNGKFTYAQLLKLSVNSFGLNLDTIKFVKAPKATDYFKNADDNAWYAEAAIIASVHSVEIKNDINLNDGVTKEELINTVVKLSEKAKNLPMIKIIPQKISDEDKLTADYQGSIQRALVAYKAIELDSKGNLNPKQILTRAEAIELTHKILVKTGVIK